jgi:hypothetical protein
MLVTLLIIVAAVIAVGLILYYRTDIQNGDNHTMTPKPKITPQELSKILGPNPTQREFINYCNKDADERMRNCQPDKDNCEKIRDDFYQDCLAQTDTFL